MMDSTPKAVDVVIIIYINLDERKILICTH